MTHSVGDENDHKKYMIINFGGNSVQITITDRKDIIGERSEQIGGKDVTELFVQYCTKNCKGKNITADDKMMSLGEECETAKILLCTRDHAEVSSLSLTVKKEDLKIASQPVISTIMSML